MSERTAVLKYETSSKRVALSPGHTVSKKYKTKTGPRFMCYDNADTIGALLITVFARKSSNALDDMPSVGVALATCSTDICSAWVVSSCKSEERVDSIATTKKKARRLA